MLSRKTSVTTLFVLLVLCAAGLSPMSALAQEEQMPPMGPPAELAKCENLLGDWNVTMKFRMGPGAPWQESAGNASYSKFLNGCALRQDFTGEVMGMTMHGMELLTYNRETKQYESIWLDDMSAHFSMSAGNYEGDKLITMGEDMQMGMKMHTKNVSWQTEDGAMHFTMEMSMDGGETWFESMQFVYTRADAR